MSEYIELSQEQALAKALVDDRNFSDEKWLILKSPGQPSKFRLHVTAWTKMSDGTLGVDLETWEEYTERLAHARGL